MSSPPSTPSSCPPTYQALSQTALATSSAPSTPFQRRPASRSFSTAKAGDESALLKQQIYCPFLESIDDAFKSQQNKESPTTPHCSTKPSNSSTYPCRVARVDGGILRITKLLVRAPHPDPGPGDHEEAREPWLVKLLSHACAFADVISQHRHTPCPLTRHTDDSDSEEDDAADVVGILGCDLPTWPSTWNTRRVA
ncbi:hypothetical protein JB92DRAFT_2838969 [Gautieria morchelliformis]|nr:hypothetical protein JB92DRAFT_2838969 [Gautieria morchelliformis]